MLHVLARICLVAFCCSWPVVHAQTVNQSSGTLIIVPAFGEVRQPNDEARVTFMVEEQDKDVATASSRVNRKMKQGTEILKREDAQAQLQTRGYYTYPVYAAEAVVPRQSGRTRQLLGWRVGQYLDLTTTNLDRLPATVAAAQTVLALNGLQFGLSQAASKKLDEQRIAVAYLDLTQRVAAIAKAMGRDVSDASYDTIDFEGSGVYAPQADAMMQKTMRASSMESAPVEEPSFEPGETTLSTRIVGRVRFK